MDANKIIEHLNRLVFFNGFTSEEKTEVTNFTKNFVQHREGSLIVRQDSNDPSL